jgi:hypothetical protein
VNTRSLGKAASSYTGLQYSTADSDPVPPTETAGAAMGTDSASEIQDTIERMIASAKLNGMSSVGLTRARELLQDFREIFRIRPWPLFTCVQPGHKQESLLFAS